ncbi:MAG TPA: methylisocitrate lyase [Nitrospiraceae bacterium]|nr:methylisocitrate lyase [Nitrospiraceae bacterium]
MSKPQRLRELLAGPAIAMPGAFNALSALQIERLGFDALYVSGAGISASKGVPDIGLLSMTEMVAEARSIAGAVGIPALADVDTGYGPPLNVMRTVREFEEAGVAGIQMEDQENPKKCGHLSGKRLVAATEMAEKIAAAARARRDPAFVIVARTDARAVEGPDGAVRRAVAYVKAGADAIFPEALESADEFKAFAQALSTQGLKVPLIANMTEFGKSPSLTVKQFEALGYSVVLFPVSALRAAMKAMEVMLADLKTNGTLQPWLGRMQTRQQLYDLLRYAEYEQQDKDLHDRHGKESH